MTPSSAQIAKGTTQQFAATGKYSDGSSKNLTNSVTWGSSAASIAGISTSGVAWASQPGSANITASDGAIQASATLTVIAAPLVSISVSPANLSLAAGTRLQLSAIGVFQDGSTQDLTTSVTWATNDPAVATVSTTGLLLASETGTARVAASKGSISTTVGVTVKSAALQSLAISPVTASIAKGTTSQFKAIGAFTDGTTQDVTSAVTWSSSMPTVASVAAGLASGVAPGSTVITATSNAISASATLTVSNATAVSISVTPVNPTLVVGLFQQFTATGSFSDGTTQDISASVNWAASAPTVAGVNTAGLVSGISPGTAVISTTFEQVSGSSTLTVKAPSLTSISVTPAMPSIANTTNQPFFVTGYYDDGSTQTLNNATWSSSNTPVVSMNGNLAVSKQPGTTTITAAVGSFTASTILTVTSATLVSIAVTPINASMAPGTAKAFFATGSFSDGSTQNLTSSAVWNSSNTSAATMNGNTATAVSGGTTTISAVFNGTTGSAELTVTQAKLTSLAVTPSNPVLVVGATQQFAATGTFDDGSTQDLTSLVTWNSSSTSTATISSTGMATGQGGGACTISATYGGTSASTSLSVSTASLASLSISPATATIPPGISQQFSAIGTYSDGTVLKVTTMARWTSSDATVATVGNTGNSGQVTGVGMGWTRISAVLNSIIASAIVNVNNATLVSLSISPANPTLSLGSNQQMMATGTFSDGSSQDLTQWVSWASSNNQVCVVNSSGYAITSGSGTTTITASFGSVNATTALTAY
ncbi:MAG: beta strand repeat-containing protein [Chlamydiota bacterium]